MKKLHDIHENPFSYSPELDPQRPEQVLFCLKLKTEAVPA